MLNRNQPVIEMAKAASTGRDFGCTSRILGDLGVSRHSYESRDSSITRRERRNGKQEQGDWGI